MPSKYTRNQAERLAWLLLNEKPTEVEIDHAVEFWGPAGRDGGYYWPDERVLGPFAANKFLLLYSSCHCEQILTYLKRYRQDVLAEYNVHVLMTHRLQLDPVATNNRLTWSCFKNADLIIWTRLPEKFGAFSTVQLEKHCKPSCKTVDFTPPTFASFWPVAEFFGEEAVQEYMLAGKTADEMVELFKAGHFDCHFRSRWPEQCQALEYRERNREVKILEYMKRHFRTHKMLFTTNHPGGHLVGWIVDESLGRLGFKQLGEEHTLLEVPTSLHGFGEHHFPETDYEFSFYKFIYPKQFTSWGGGPEQYYENLIRKTLERRSKLKKPEVIDREADY